ncbi:MAG TPA: N-acetylmuramoyl-L-alanine amidase [Azoarcus taiwanensis]|uniref:N-acetylmuramoyl-L-alanine amidase AmiC n=1 Tax=Azoarcus taiwanensis TaxID=666964 RepID=A0A972FG89_9RHOO|nr:N-acetylmuramoyl-L-alanine amidase [Azoarcus taiwanensis]NMG04787.1 AMIN domain-containing protein [Azoarcus taiwanensis]HRQ56814.1 N-acetylmuramoyl-L-alanine amidase [Azoarcus taiwanensis]
MHENNEEPTAEHGPVNLPAGVSRRQMLQFAGATLALLVSPVGFASARSLVAVRVWPATDYTRITLESNAEISFKYLTLDNPDRLVVDLEGVELNSVLKSLPDRVLDTDPVISLIRAANNRPGVVRIVVELKGTIKPSIFTLNPIANYGHRLVLDLYPTEPIDPILALIRKRTPMEAASGEGGGERVATGDNAAGNAQVADANRILTVVIDAGHGGEDPGAVGRRGTYEKNVTLAIATRLKRRIDAEPGMQAIMTRNGDYFVPLQQRVAIARRAQADLFVSIHADAFVRPEAHGSSVYVLSESGATSSAARWLAQRENEADLIGGVNLAKQDGHLARTLLDLSQTATINDSLKLGKAMLSELGGVNRLHKPQVEQAGFAVLRAPDIPSILVETAFISNPDEERRLNDAAYQDKMADALMRGIRRYFQANPPVHRTTVARAG